MEKIEWNMWNRYLEYRFRKTYDIEMVLYHFNIICRTRGACPEIAHILEHPDDREAVFEFLGKNI
jgi:hypothetical protein